MAIKHPFVSGKADGGDASLVRPGNWNADHTIENDTITYAQIQNISATDRILGRASGGAGDIEEIVCTPTARTLLDDGNVGTMRTTLGLLALATKNTVATAEIDDAAVTLAKQANLANQRIIGRDTAGAGVPEAITASQLFDWVSNTNGVLLTRTAGSWAAASKAGIDGGDLVVTSGTPTTPAAGKVKLFGADMAGRQSLGMVNPDGGIHELQASIGKNKVFMWLPNGGANNALTTLGSQAPVVAGTATGRAHATTTIATTLRRLGYVSAASAGQAAGVRSNAVTFVRGTAAGMGGFHVILRFFISDAVLVATANMFCGIGGVAAPTDVGPETLTNLIGVGCTNGDTQMQLYAAGAAAQARTALGANFPVNTINTDLYELQLYAPPNASDVKYLLTRLNTGHTVAGTISAAANLFANNMFVGVNMWRSNGGTAAAVGLDFVSCYVETDV